MPVGTCFSNNQLQLSLNRIVTLLNNNLSIRLFQNNFTPNAGTLYGTFVEATFNGYNRINSSGKFSNSSKAADGKYLAVSGAISFPFPFGAPQTIYGWYITDYPYWVCAGNFPIPIVTAAPVPVTFTITLLYENLQVACN